MARQRPMDPAVIDKLKAGLAILAALVVGIFAYQRVKYARRSRDVANATAKALELNADQIEDAAERAEEARQQALDSQRKGDEIKRNAETKLRELHEQRGSNTARALADRLSGL